MSLEPLHSSAFIVDSIPFLEALLDTLFLHPIDPPSLYIDIEGLKLSRHGSISVLTLYIASVDKVYLIDVFVLREAAFTTPNRKGNTLKNYLEAPNIPKVFFDVRNDSDALFAHYGVSLAGVHDLQVMELATRHYSRNLFASFTKCVEGSGIALPTIAIWKQTKEAGKMVLILEHGGEWETFNVRPMPQVIMNYCTNDVVLMPTLWGIYSRVLAYVDPVWKVRAKQEAENRIAELQLPKHDPFEHNAVNIGSHVGKAQWHPVPMYSSGRGELSLDSMRVE